MTVVRINALTVPEGSGDELARRFANRAGRIEDTDGFIGFDLLKPTDGRNTWLVVTRWRDAEAYNAWTANRRPHRSSDNPAPVTTESEVWSFDLVDGTTADRGAVPPA